MNGCELRITDTKSGIANFGKIKVDSKIYVFVIAAYITLCAGASAGDVASCEP